MMRMKSILNIVTLLMLTISVIGCSDEPVSTTTTDDSEIVNFIINIYAGDPGNGSRSAGPVQGNLSDPDYYEQPQTQYETMRTLRVIIVRPDNTVEHNEYLYRSIPNNGISQYSNIRLKVIGGEKKKVYLFANEASIIPSGETLAYNFNSITPGSQFPTEAIGNLTLSRDAANGEAFIDNRSGSNKVYIPMAEVFDVDIAMPKKDGTDLEQRANLFITRAAVKFSFYISASLAPDHDYNITAISVSNIADRQYLLPCEATYVPGKYPASFSDRYIKSYAIPDDVEVSNFVYAPSAPGITIPTTIKPTDVIAYAPAVYLPESPAGTYRVKVTFDGNNELTSEADLPNLPALPRNTHVKVNITLAKANLKCTVDVLPYSAVPLNPEFGFDELLPRPPVVSDEIPPWIEIHPDE